MPRKKSIVPIPRLHKASGQAYICIDGKDVYLGKWKSPEAEQEYKRLVLEQHLTGTLKKNEVVINVLIAKYLEFVETDFKSRWEQVDGRIKRVTVALRPLAALYGTHRVEQFGPLALKAVREEMVRSGRLCRNTINERIQAIREVFRWGVENELVQETIHRALMAVKPLEAGRTAAVDHQPVPEAPMADVLKTVDHSHKILGDMILVQMDSAMRGQEVRLMRPCDIDTSDDIWIYTPYRHKTQHKGKSKIIPIMPDSQAILMSYLIAKEKHPEEYVFSPADAMKLLSIQKRKDRKSKVQPSQQKRKAKGRKYLPCYTKDAYANAIEKAAKRAGVPHWTPHQLRHTKATEVKQKLGKEAAQMLLGHADMKTTEGYIDPDAKLKAEIEGYKELGRKIHRYRQEARGEG